MEMKRSEDPGGHDRGSQPRIGLGLDERLLEQSLRPLEIVERELPEPSQHIRALDAGR
jgi:hypothetical protein